MAKAKSDLATIVVVAQLLGVVVSVAALYFARDVFIPLVLGLLLSFLLSPFVNRMHRWGVPNVMAVVTTAILAFLLLAGLFTMLGRELTTLVSDLPQHRQELLAKARTVAGMTTGVGGSLDDLADEVTEAMVEADEGEPATAEPESDSFIQRWTASLLPSEDQANVETANTGASPKAPLYVTQVERALPLASWATTAGTLLGPLATAGLVTVFALFMLIHREDLRDRIIAVVSHGNYVTTTEALDEAAERISRYLIAQTIINTSYGFVMTLGLAAIGMLMTEEGVFPNAILWGVLATCLRYVPYIGPTVSAIFPLAIALSVFPGYNVAIAVFVLIVVMELVSNNVLEPWLYGASTGISAVAVIFAAVFWGWLWGPVGLLLSTPLTVCLVVLGRYVPRFRILSTLLGEDIKISTSVRFYHRILAGDDLRAWELLQAHLNDKDFDAVCDDIIIPALKRIRNDQETDRLKATDADRLFAMIGGLIAKLHQHLDAGTQATQDPDVDQQMGEGSAQDLPVLVGCASHHFSEMLILNMLEVSSDEQFQLRTTSDELLPADVGRQIQEVSPSIVVIVVLPSGGFAQARYLCRQIRKQAFEGPIIVACFGKFKNFDKLFVKFRKVGATSMTTSYSQTHSKIQSILNRRDTVANIPYRPTDAIAASTT
jgi:predicted PurR-regulated permease PerM